MHYSKRSILKFKKRVKTDKKELKSLFWLNVIQILQIALEVADLIDFCTMDDIINSYFHQHDGLQFVRISCL